MNLQILYNASLKKFNTLRLEARAHTCYVPLTIEGVHQAIQLAKGKKLVLLGNGSNVLFAKDYYDESYAFVVTNRLDDMEIVNNELVVYAGVKLHDLAWFAMDNQIGGYEFCEDIPGTVGGALIMNAGQWEYTIGQYVHWVKIYNLTSEKVQTIIPDDDFFTYRYSRFNEMNAIILSAGLNIQPGDYNDIFNRMMDFKKERYMKQPRNYPNAGSVFKRPFKNGESLFVWKLFDEVDLRGYQIGGAQISPKHPGFIVNVDQATCKDCIDLIDECKSRISKRFDVDLELEWRVIK
jgi:UDP-N-acetylmuramate dehydrogenase